MSWYKGKYDPADFVVPPELKGGHSQKLQFNVQSGHFKAIEISVKAGVFPFNSSQDFGRWAVREGLLRLDHLEPKLIPTILRQADSINDMLAEQIYNAKYEENFGQLREMTQKYLGLGQREMAEELALKFYRHVVGMPDAPKSQLFWKRRWETRLLTEFGDLLNTYNENEEAA